MDSGKERGISPEELETYESRYRAGLQNFLLFLEDFADIPRVPDPSAIDMGDERTFEELSEGEMKVIKQALYEEFAIDPIKQDTVVRTYQTEAPSEATVPGPIKATVFKTNRKGVFLQELVYSDNAVRYAAGPDMDI